MPPQRLKIYLDRYRPEFFLFGIAFALRLIFLALMSARTTADGLFFMTEDTRTYVNIARYLLGAYAPGESDLLLAGPGYGAFLALFMLLFGQTPWPILFAQIILSSLSVVFIYHLALILLENRTIAFIAALLAALSLTSISLSNILLSDTLFFFLMASGFYFFLTGLKEPRPACLWIAGLILGVSVLVRSVAAFFPVLLIFIAIIYPLTERNTRRKNILIHTGLACLIIVLISSAWGVRNYSRHSLFTVSETGTLAAKRYLCARVIYEATGKQVKLKDFRDRLSEPLMIGDRPATAKEEHDDALRVVRETYAKYPGLFVKIFFKNIRENIALQSTIHPVQLSQFRNQFEWYTRHVTDEGKHFLYFYLSLLGTILLIIKRLWRQAVILGAIYIYFALLSGFTYWQGSRIFFPASLAWTILIATALWGIYNIIFGRRRKAGSR